MISGIGKNVVEKIIIQEKILGVMLKSDLEIKIEILLWIIIPLWYNQVCKKMKQKR